MPFTPGQQIRRGTQAAYGAGSRAFGGIIPPFLQGARNMRSRAKSFGGRIPKAGFAFAGIDAAIRLAQGQNAGQALGGAASSMAGAAAGGKLGAAIGTVITPVAGTAIGAVIGSVAGGILGDKAFSAVYDALAPSNNAQMVAAQAQKDAAAAMRGIPTISDKDVGPASEFAGAGAIGIAQLGKAFKYAGLEGDKSSQAYMTATTNLTNLREEYQRLNDLAASQKGASGRVTTEVQAKLDAARKALTEGEKQTAAAWDRISKTNKDKINNAIVLMQTSTTAFNTALVLQADNVARAMREATAKINAAKLTPDAVKTLSDLLPDAPDKPTPQIKPTYNGNISEALSKEMRNMPVGAKPVIANDYETIIPPGKTLAFMASNGLYNPYSGRGGTSTVQVNAPITINGTGMDSEEIAYAVARKLGEAMDRASSSLFV
jgi:hypothetical protein